MKQLLRYGALIGLLLASLARAELTIEITQGVDKPTPIAVAPFGWQQPQAMPEDIASIVEADLHRSGLFEPMARQNMLSFPSTAGEVYFRDWRQGGQEYLLIGNIEPQAGDRYLISFELFDVLKEQRLIGETLSGNRRQLRRMAHTIADKVYEKLTGIPGAFSTQIVYVTAQRFSKDNYRYQLQLADADGANPRQILDSREPILSPSWSRDGKKLAYVSFETGRPAIYIQNLATGAREKVTGFRGLNGAPSWSPDGRTLALTLSKDGNPEIYTLDIATRKLTRITKHYGIDTEPTWSADGRSIIFTSNRGGQPQIYQKELATGWIERLSFDGDYNAKAHLTQDGRHLVMVHRERGVFNIAVQDLKTGRLDVLSQTSLDESPSIAPNGSMVIYATKQAGKEVLSVVSLDGQVKYKLPSKQGNVREPSWSPYLQ
ncbi:Tol-Pal system protein TolB [Motiliproteus coralliicola]|uniref:Tol-Pal system protein TolB n=1 Tax=Motiliproteus coralliicola TaxID=2283196 RepID=A0A369WRD9_9GAMM|nr:Tol-Pal system beta propeller repeat protein TolB [Motiliproteus coralliicola]RDE24252.1 Tol-Pal system protein TolB [Motiliproteus coralliicola]